MISRMFDSGAIPTLERLVQFTGERHRVLSHNIANLSTPYFKPRDLDPGEFQAELRRAVEKRRGTAQPLAGELDLDDTDQLRFHEEGIDARPGQRNENILFHDQNNRGLEQIMQDLAENTLTHKTGVDLLKNEFDMLRMAIRERI